MRKSRDGECWDYDDGWIIRGWYSAEEALSIANGYQGTSLELNEVTVKSGYYRYIPCKEPEGSGLLECDKPGRGVTKLTFVDIL